MFVCGTGKQIIICFAGLFVGTAAGIYYKTPSVPCGVFRSREIESIVYVNDGRGGR